MKRPTIRSIARLAGVCPMTVSLSLRNHNKISLKTRQRIQQLAQKMGYRPDPSIAKLMHHLRTRRRDRPNAAIAALVSPAAVSYSAMVLQGVLASTERHGYAVDVFHIRRGALDRRTLRRTLRNRGIEGVVICPQVPSDVFCDLLEWERFSVVATSYTWNAPLFTRVVPDGFGNTLSVCEKLAGAGFRRIGLVETKEIDEIVRHHFSAAAIWHSVYASAAHLPVLLLHSTEKAERLIVDWFEQHRPDVILGGDMRITHFCQAALAAAVKIVPPVICISEEDGPSKPCVVQNPEQVGRTAIELLAGMLQRGDRGVPFNPVTVQVPGEWRGGELHQMQAR
jgi:DNA-binding LacI/PurR family transcriptional regulator